MDKERAHNQRAQKAGSLNNDLDGSLLLTVRACLLALALLLASFYGIYLDREGGSAEPFSYPRLGLLLVFCLLSAAWMVWRRTDLLFAYAQFGADALLTTAIVYLTGGPISPFIFLYLPIVMGAAAVASQQAALIIAAFSLGSYLGLLWAVAPADLPAHGLGWQIIGLASGMVLVAAATSFLRRKIRAGHVLAEKSQRDLVNHTTRQQTLIQGLSDGVIIAAAEGRVSSINQAACALLHICEADAIGRRLGDVCRNIFDQEGGAPAPADFGEAPREYELKIPGNEESTKVLFSSRAIVGDREEPLGTVCVFQNVTQLRSAEEQLALQERMAKLLARQHEPRGSAHPKLHEFVGESPVMKKVFYLIERISASDANVLITGESGTGKELAAKAIHLSGHRCRGPFVAINCGAVPENLIESQLFGHKKGSFTSADSDQIGFFQQAQGGTIFLDEIAELPLHMQSKLLRAIQERSIRPIGSEREIPIDVRIVSATNKNLRQQVSNGAFREDLFYRLNVVGITLPPLRDRKEDIPVLVNSILKRLVNNDTTPVVPPATMQLLMNYAYPGNVRELENLLERALVLGGEVLLPEHLPDQVRTPAAAAPGQLRETTIIVDETLELPIDLDGLLSTIERRYIEVALLKTKGAKKKAADLLGMNFRSFRYRLQKFGIGE
jgi:transcriptional regulator with PAS, ATPase and Fis domain